MKKIFLILFGAAIFLAPACRQVDQELVDKMEAQLNTIKQSAPGIEEAAKKSSELVKRMTMAPNALKYYTKFNYAEVFEQANAINGKYNTLQSLCSSGTFQLDSMIQNYSNGNLKKDDVAAAFQNLSGSLEGLQGSVEHVTPFFDQVTASYSKMLDDWNALPEAEKRSAESALLSIKADASNTPGLTPKK